MQPYLALITPLSGAHPDNSLPGQQPGIDNSLPGQPPYPSQGPGFPTNPIAPGGRPPYPSQGPGFPTHPIAPGGPPLGTWGGVGQPYPDQGLPGFPETGQPGSPTHPIVIPPSGNRPDNTLPGQQPGIDNSLPEQPQVGFIVAYMPGQGYRWVIVPAEVDNSLPGEAEPK